MVVQYLHRNIKQQTLMGTICTIGINTIADETSVFPQLRAGILGCNCIREWIHQNFTRLRITQRLIISPIPCHYSHITNYCAVNHFHTFSSEQAPYRAFHNADDQERFSESSPIVATLWYLLVPCNKSSGNFRNLTNDHFYKPTAYCGTCIL